MSRPRSPWWHKRDRAYYTKVDGVQIALRHPTAVPGRLGPKVGHGDEAGIRAAMDRILADYDSSIRRANDPTVRDLCDSYLLACSETTTTETMVGKSWVLKKFCKFGSPPFGTLPARTIDVVSIHTMGKAWKKEGYSVGTIRRLYREVMACWAWASRPEPERTPVVMMDKNPLAGFKIPALPARKNRYLSLKSINEITEFAKDRAKKMGPLRSRFEQQAILMLRLLTEAGCRPKEACTATWDDYDPDDGMIVLNRHKTAEKTGNIRMIVVLPQLNEDLIAHRDSGHAHPVYLFAHPRSKGESSVGAHRETGAPWTRPGYTVWFKKLIADATASGIKLPDGLSLYWLRHSFVTDAAIGEGAGQAADLAGNSKEMARGTYYHVQKGELRKAAKRVAQRREEGQEES